MKIVNIKDNLTARRFGHTCMFCRKTIDATTSITRYDIDTGDEQLGILPRFAHQRCKINILEQK